MTTDQPKGPTICQADAAASTWTALECPNCGSDDVYCVPPPATPWPLDCPPPVSWLHSHGCRTCGLQEWFTADDEAVTFPEDPFDHD